MKKASKRQVGGDHYKNLPIQPGEFITRNGIGWYEANAIKYICRHKQKGGRVDLEKAIHYLQLAMEEHYESKKVRRVTKGRVSKGTKGLRNGGRE